MVVALATLIAVGIRIAAHSGLDNAKLLVIGTSVVIGLGVETVPGLTAEAPACLALLFASGTCTGALCAIVLNQILGRISRPDRAAPS